MIIIKDMIVWNAVFIYYKAIERPQGMKTWSTVKFDEYLYRSIKEQIFEFNAFLYLKMRF